MTASCPTLRQLGDLSYFPYRWGQAFWAYAAGRWGDDIIRSVFDEALVAASATTGFEKITGIDDKDLSSQWHQAIREQYAPILAASQPPSRSAQGLTADDESRGALAVSPVSEPRRYARSYFSPAATCFRLICFSRTPSPGGSSGSS